MTQPTNANNDSYLGIRFFNIYEGSRKEEKDKFEKFGEFYAFCLNQAIGKKVTLREGTRCEVKTSQIALRILFGFVALATLPFTLVGTLLVVLSKSHKKIHQEALVALNLPISAPSKGEEPVLSNVLPTSKKEEPVLSNVLPTQKKEEPVQSNVLPQPKPSLQENPKGRILFNFPSKTDEKEVKHEDQTELSSLNPPNSETAKEEKLTQNPTSPALSNEQQMHLAAALLQMCALNAFMQQNQNQATAETKINPPQQDQTPLAPTLETKNPVELPEALATLLTELQSIYMLATAQLNSLTLDSEEITEKNINQNKAIAQDRLKKIKDGFEEEITNALKTKETILEGNIFEQFDSNLKKLRDDFNAAYHARVQSISEEASSLVEILKPLSPSIENKDVKDTKQPDAKAQEAVKVLPQTNSPKPINTQNILDVSLKSAQIDTQIELLIKEKILLPGKAKPVLDFIDKHKAEKTSFFNTEIFNENDLLGRAIKFDRTPGFMIIDRLFNYMVVLSDTKAHPKKFINDYIQIIEGLKDVDKRALRNLILQKFKAFQK